MQETSSFFMCWDKKVVFISAPVSQCKLAAVLLRTEPARILAFVGIKRKPTGWIMSVLLLIRLVSPVRNTENGAFYLLIKC